MSAAGSTRFRLLNLRRISVAPPPQSPRAAAPRFPTLSLPPHTWMRPSEQYGLTWDRVDLHGRRVTIPRSKSGQPRHIPLNSEALAAFKLLAQRSPNETGPVFVNLKGEKLQGYKHWFD